MSQTANWEKCHVPGSSEHRSTPEDVLHPCSFCCCVTPVPVCPHRVKDCLRRHCMVRAARHTSCHAHNPLILHMQELTSCCPCHWADSLKKIKYVLMRVGERKMWNLYYVKGTMKAFKIKAPISIQVKNNCV